MPEDFIVSSLPKEEFNWTTREEEDDDLDSLRVDLFVIVAFAAPLRAATFFRRSTLYPKDGAVISCSSRHQGYISVDTTFNELTGDEWNETRETKYIVYIVAYENTLESYT